MNWFSKKPPVNNDKWTWITDIKDIPDAETLWKTGTFGDLFHITKLMYTKNLEMVRANENRDHS